MKTSIIKTILGVVTLLSLFLACAEADTILSQVIWTSSCLYICYLSGKAFTKYLTKEEQEERV